MEKPGTLSFAFAVCESCAVWVLCATWGQSNSGYVVLSFLALTILAPIGLWLSNRGLRHKRWTQQALAAIAFVAFTFCLLISGIGILISALAFCLHGHGLTPFM
jgi:hypothetical protein